MSWKLNQPLSSSAVSIKMEEWFGAKQFRKMI